MQRKNPIHVNQGFTCEKCGHKTKKAAQSCRNHCPQCLHSKHVDEHTPGDRLSLCNGLMAPIRIVTHSQKGHQIQHQCQRCGIIHTNKTAPDDNLDLIITTMQRQNLDTPPL